MEIDARKMMIKAIGNDNLDMAVKALLNGFDPLTYINLYQIEIALINAVAYRREKIVRLLIPYSDCNQRSYGVDTTAPTYATRRGYTDILKFILPHTDLTLRDKDGDIEDNTKIYGHKTCLDLIHMWKSLIRNRPKTQTVVKMCLQWHEISMPTDFYEEVVKNWLIVSLDKK